MAHWVATLSWKLENKNQMELPITYCFEHQLPHFGVTDTPVIYSSPKSSVTF